MKKLIPNINKHFKNINTGDIYEGEIYLGIHDNENNYIQVSKEEYQKYLELNSEENND